jgi:NADPH:quinone reductase
LDSPASGDTVERMRSLRLHALGEPVDVLRIEERDIPEPRPGEVVVKVEASALNFPDVLLCRGQYQEKPPLPFTPGVEMAGVVTAIGDGVTNVKPGDRVLGSPTYAYGGLTEYTIALASSVSVIPEAMGFDAAAALRVTYYTGHAGLHRRAQLQPGETVLVHAGAGGVGSAAIQLAKAHGCSVIATAGGPDKVAVCEKLGADLAIDYRATDFVDAVKEFTGGRGADVIYDPVGGDTYDRSTKVIAWEGRILIIGFTSGRIAEAKTNHILIKNYSVVGLHWGAYTKHEPSLNTVVHNDLMRLFQEGKIDPLVSEVVPLAGAAEAMGRLGDRGTVGKVVVHPHE